MKGEGTACGKLVLRTENAIFSSETVTKYININLALVTHMHAHTHSNECALGWDGVLPPFSSLEIQNYLPVPEHKQAKK